MKTSTGRRDSGCELKRWRRLAVFWPLLCVVFAVVILYQAVVYHTVPGMEERAADAAFTLIPLVFFAIGMRIRRRMLKERESAVMPTCARVISEGMTVRTGHKRYYYPEYEFRVGEKTYRVRSRSGYGTCPVTVGKEVELYYAPENPEIFYVPYVQRHDRKLSALFCGIGILFPLIGFFAPAIRMLIPV